MSKLVTSVVFLAVLLVGCTSKGVTSCSDYCASQPHADCVGSWSVAGSYPNCSCVFKCDVSSLGGLEDFNVSVGGLSDLGGLPEVNKSVKIGGGILSSNPFPSEPSLQ